MNATVVRLHIICFDHAVNTNSRDSADRLRLSKVVGAIMATAPVAIARSEPSDTVTHLK